MKRQPRMQTIPQPILEKSSSPAIMDLNEEYAWYNDETEVIVDYNNRYPAHDCTKSIRSLDVPSPKVNKENCFPDSPILKLNVVVIVKVY